MSPGRIKTENGALHRAKNTFIILNFMAHCLCHNFTILHGNSIIIAHSLPVANKGSTTTCVALKYCLRHYYRQKYIYGALFMSKLH